MWKKRAAARGTYTLTEQRAYFDTEMSAVPIAPGCTVQTLTLAGMPAELIQHPGAVAGKILLYLHGGGYVFGSIRSHRHLVLRYAVAASVAAVLSPWLDMTTTSESYSKLGAHDPILTAK